MARKKKGGHGGGGHGGWFVTFADLMGLLMSFFVMLTAFSTQDAKKLQAVAGSMREAFGNQKNPRLAGIVEQDGIPTRPHLKNVKHAPPEEGSDYTVPDQKNQKDMDTKAQGANRMSAAAASLRQAMMDMPELAELSKQIMIEETREGLSISLVDQDGRSMFAEGSVQPYERTRRAIDAIAQFLKRIPNRISVTGHTSASRPGGGGSWSNWELSAGRAATVREIMARAGIPDTRFHAIAGKADSEPMFPDNPYFSANRRVTILMMREESALPASARP